MIGKPIILYFKKIVKERTGKAKRQGGDNVRLKVRRHGKRLPCVSLEFKNQLLYADSDYNAILQV
jgi:hypothetical protein